MSSRASRAGVTGATVSGKGGLDVPGPDSLAVTIVAVAPVGMDLQGTQPGPEQLPQIGETALSRG